MISDKEITCPFCGRPVASDNAHFNGNADGYPDDDIDDITHDNIDDDSNDDSDTNPTSSRIPDDNSREIQPSVQKWLYAIIGGLVAALLGLGLLAWNSGIFSKGTPPLETEVKYSVPEVEEQVTLVYCNSADGFVNIRRSPSAKSDTLGKLVKNGPPATLIADNGKWYKVKYDNIEGFVNKKYAKIENGTLNATNSNKVYYIYFGKWDSLKKAQANYKNLPESLDKSDIYKTAEKGKAVYLMVVEKYTSKNDAQKHINNLKSKYGETFNMWESDGPAELVYSPENK